MEGIGGEIFQLGCRLDIPYHGIRFCHGNHDSNSQLQEKIMNITKPAGPTTQARPKSKT